MRSYQSESTHSLIIVSGKLEIEDADGRIRPQHVIVHRANPADQFNEQSFLDRVSASTSKVRKCYNLNDIDFKN